MKEITLQLTPRSTKILTYLSQGLSAIQIAKKLKISSSTVRNDITTLLRMTNTKNQTHLIYTAIKFGLIK